MGSQLKPITYFFLFLLYALPVQADTVLVAAASNIQLAFKKLTRDFRRTHPEINIKVSFGSSGNFYSQIVHGAPYDLFFSADMSLPQKLEEAGLSSPGNQTTPYAFGRIVLWMANDAGINLHSNKLKGLANLKIKKIAIANPRHAPYGRAAIESMQHFSIYEKIKSKLKTN